MSDTADPSPAEAITHESEIALGATVYSNPEAGGRVRSPHASVENMLGEAFRLGRLSAWTQGPLDWIVALTGRLAHVPDLDRRQEIETMLDAATEMVVLRRSSWAWRQRFSDWWNGTRVEAATTLLDEAAIRFVEYADAEGLRLAVDDAVGYAETLPADDLMRVRFEETLALLGDETNAPDVAQRRRSATVGAAAPTTGP